MVHRSPGDSQEPPVDRLEQIADALARELEEGDGLDLVALLAIWRAQSVRVVARGPQAGRSLGRGLIRRGEPLVAYEILSEVLRSWPEDVELQQLQALALARSGATSSAFAILERLQAEGRADEETLGLLARLSKDRAFESPEGSTRSEHLAQAYERYLEAYRRTGGYWTGVNAATMALLLGRHEESQVIAQEVEGACREILAREGTGGRDSYWVVATLGEAALIRNRLAEAQDWYAQASETWPDRVGDLSSTRRNARLICGQLGIASDFIDRAVRIPSVAVCAGHMMDRPGRSHPRFPPELESAVAVELRRRLERADARVGYASAACGSDILFLEAVLELHGEIRVVLPYERERFVSDSVTITGSSWEQRFERVLERATEVVVASEQGSASDLASFEYVNRLLFGLAKDRSRRLETRLVPTVVWDGLSGDGPGGTASVVELWGLRDRDTEMIDLGSMLRRQRPELPEGPAPATAGEPETASPAPAMRTVAILFADAVNFSKLTEDRIPEFVHGFLGAIGRLARRPHTIPLFSNTWGDGLVFVFSSVAVAGRFALDMAAEVRAVAAAQPPHRPLPDLRIGLHAGPVFEAVDPVTGHPTFFGTHLTRAARIEPITPPGHVYASQAFAVIAAFEDVQDFACEYVGRVPFAKGYGAHPLYHVRGRGQPVPR
jgi:class 3 adenylate cyclase/tetratricopeptide (TPR) repeat protein